MERVGGPCCAGAVRFASALELLSHVALGHCSPASGAASSAAAWRGVRAVKAPVAPSRFCHICSRTGSKVRIISCHNVRSGRCRKVICDKCFSEFGWDWGTACRGEWLCTHCRGQCPERAQCSVYRRTNERRRELLLSRRGGRTAIFKTRRAARLPPTCQPLHFVPPPSSSSPAPHQ